MNIPTLDPQWVHTHDPSTTRRPSSSSRLCASSQHYSFPTTFVVRGISLGRTAATDDSRWRYCRHLKAGIRTISVMNAQTPEEILTQLRELLHFVRKEVRTDGLQAAISSLQGALDANLYVGEKRAIVQCYLTKAMLTRYGIHGWINDLDGCYSYSHIECAMKYADQLRDGGIGQVQTAAHLLQESRRLLHISTLNTIIRTAEAALSSFIQGGSTLQVTELFLILGNALVMRFLRKCEARDLCHASASFQHAKRTCDGHPAYENLCLTYLAFAEWLRVIEWGQVKSLGRLNEYYREIVEMDIESNVALSKVLPLLSEGEITGVELEDVITTLSTCLQSRKAPHPRRLLPLHNLGIALHFRYGYHRDLETLEKCILLHREGLTLRPVYHPSRSLSLASLSKALLYRFERNEVLSELDEIIMLCREWFALDSPNDPIHRNCLKDLGNSLLLRCERRKEYNDLEEAISLLTQAVAITPQAHEDRPTTVEPLACALYVRFKREKRLQDVDRSIVLHREVLQLRGPSHQNQCLSLTNLADSLYVRFEEKGDTQDLEECLAFYWEAINSPPAKHTAHHHALQKLAEVLLVRYEREGKIEDLETSIKLFREAVIQSAPKSRPGILPNLARALFQRFEKLGNSEDLEESIQLDREALDLEPPQSPDWFTLTNNLANNLLVLFLQRGKAQDLEECITRHRESMTFPPALNPIRDTSLMSLGNALFFRFEQKGVTQDLLECLELQRQALSILPAPSAAHPGSRSKLLINLGNTLNTLYERNRSRQDLEESITIHREALALSRKSEPDRPKALNSLARGLLARYSLDGVLDDIEECINLHREGLTLRPPPDHNRWSTLINLAVALRTRFKRTRNIQDGDECILLCREALDLQSNPHPSRQRLLSTLAEGLRRRFKLIWELGGKNNISIRSPAAPARGFRGSSDDEDLIEALHCYEEGAKYDMGSLMPRFQTAKRWASCAQKYGQAILALDAYHYAIELLPQIASLEFTLSQRQDVLRHSGELVGNAVGCAASTGRFKLAVVFLSTGRSIFWSQALQLRTPVDELASSHPTLATEFISISRQLERASYALESSNTGAQWGTGGGITQSLSDLTDLRRQIIDKIRRLPDHQEFLLPPSFPSLQSGAQGGPIVFLNASGLGCDALIMQITGPVQHVPLPTTNLLDLMALKELLHTLLETGMSAIHLTQDRNEIVRNLLGRDVIRDSPAIPNETIFGWALDYLWTEVVSPVVEALNLHKTETPGRIWWCPTGPFNSLPIHAAGIYSDDNKPIDCIFQYTVSSYCTSPQDLLHPHPHIPSDFRMTAVIEPEAPGAAPLPATQEELMVIKKHVPHRRHLITHVGEGENSNKVETLITDIQRSSFVHFGCHGMQHRDNPLESYLLLSGGKLTMSRIISDCEVPGGALAYLSACETAKGDKIRPDESLNLVATMIFAGFRSVVGTMWSIYDVDAPIVADVFYRHLFRNGNGEEKTPDVRDAAYGLHLATKELRDRGRPFCSWVPYVHYGI